MRKITSISFAFGALLVAAAPALADDQQLAAMLAAQRFNRPRRREDAGQPAEIENIIFPLLPFTC